jgi:hypothetical protein
VQRVASQGQDLLGVIAHHFARGRKPYAFGAAIEEPLPVLLLQLPDLRAHRRLRAQNFFRGPRKIAELGDFKERVELVKVHKMCRGDPLSTLPVGPLLQPNLKTGFWELAIACLKNQAQRRTG